MRRLVVGTRASNLARTQTKIVTDLIQRCAPGIEIDVVAMTTRGDTRPPTWQSSEDGKAAFTSEIESMLIRGEVQVAVHSLKDLPTKLDGRLVIAATPKRGDPRDVLVSNGDKALSELPRGARVGTSSLRRKAQLLRMRDDITVMEQHGNVETRIRVMAEKLDGVVLAAAGLARLGLSERVAQYFTVDEMVPAVGQAILAVQSRKSDTEVRELLARIDDEKSRVEAACERAFAVRLGGGCSLPAGAHAELVGVSLSAVGMIATQDGKHLVKRTLNGGPASARALGRRLAAELLRDGGQEILRSVTK